MLRAVAWHAKEHDERRPRIVWMMAVTRFTAALLANFRERNAIGYALRFSLLWIAFAPFSAQFIYDLWMSLRINFNLLFSMLKESPLSVVSLNALKIGSTMLSHARLDALFAERKTTVRHRRMAIKIVVASLLLTTFADRHD